MVSGQVLTSENVFFNRQLINPVLLMDSVKMNTSLFVYNQKILNENYNGFYLNHETGLGKHKIAFGINYHRDNSIILNRKMFQASLKKWFALGRYSAIEAGINLGFNRLWLAREINVFNGQGEPVLESDSKSSNTLPLNGGISYRYKNHTFGISYNHFGGLPSTNDNFKTVNQLITNYCGKYKLSERILIEPELFVSLLSDNRYALISTQLSYDRYVTGAILYNTDEEFAIMISGTIFKHFQVGYFYEKDLNSLALNNKGVHGFRLGVLFF